MTVNHVVNQDYFTIVKVSCFPSNPVLSQLSLLLLFLWNICLEIKCQEYQIWEICQFSSLNKVHKPWINTLLISCKFTWLTEFFFQIYIQKVNLSNYKFKCWHLCKIKSMRSYCGLYIPLNISICKKMIVGLKFTIRIVKHFDVLWGMSFIEILPMCFVYI